MKSIKEMDEFIQKHCDEHSDCSGCLIENICDPIMGCFDEFEHECRKAFEILVANCDVNADDPVNHPSHYTKGKIEVADFIADQKLNFDRGNAVKYVCRAGAKDPEKEIQDLEKAVWYINHEIKMLKGETENA